MVCTATWRKRHLQGEGLRSPLVGRPRGQVWGRWVSVCSRKPQAGPQPRHRPRRAWRRKRETQGHVLSNPGLCVSAKVGETRGGGCKDAEDGGLRTTIVRFSNGDVKKTLPDQRVVRAPAGLPEKQPKPTSQRDFPSGGGVAGQKMGPLG